MSDPDAMLGGVNGAQGELFPELAAQRPAAPPSVVAGRAPAVWAELLADEAMQARYWAHVCRRGEDQHWYWIGAISDTGHGKLYAGARAGGSPRTITAHVYGFQLARGLLRPGPGEDLVVSHACDEASCQNPRCLRAVPRAENNRERVARRWSGPLVDVRGADGRAVAIREAIKAARRTGADEAGLDAAIEAAAAAGVRAAPLPYGPAQGVDHSAGVTGDSAAGVGGAGPGADDSPA